jgi:hypothetical protein
MKTSRFENGMRVVYVPSHVHGDVEHKDCETGLVSSTNDTFVFVKFYPKHVRGIFFVMDDSVTAQACNPNDLMTEEEVNFVRNV